MKVIRLVEDIKQYKELVNYGKSLGLDNATINSILKVVQAQPAPLSNANYIQFEDALEDAANTNTKKDTTSFNVNEIRNMFNSNTPETGMLLLKKLFSTIGNYGGCDAKNIGTILDKFDIKFVKYFLTCLGYENLTDRNNPILTAFANDKAQVLIGSDKNLFTKLFNLSERSNELGLDNNYLGNKNAIIFEKDLYKVDSDTIDKIVIHDKSTGCKEHDAIVTALKNGDYGSFKSKETAIDRQQADMSTKLRNMSDAQKKKFLMANGVNQETATSAVTQIAKANEINNNK